MFFGGFRGSGDCNWLQVTIDIFESVKNSGSRGMGFITLIMGKTLFDSSDFVTICIDQILGSNQLFCLHIFRLQMNMRVNL